MGKDDTRYSISEWWLEPRTKGPGAHSHADDHIFYVLAGTLSLFIDGKKTDATRGTYALIPGGVLTTNLPGVHLGGDRSTCSVKQVGVVFQRPI